MSRRTNPSRKNSKSRFGPPYLGAAYYPEDWPPEQVDEDIRLMKLAGMNVARIGEFAWSKMEPEMGIFDFAWLRRVVDKLAEAGIATILGTPTATPPIWLTKSHPEILYVSDMGVRAQHGARRHTCPSSPVYRSYCERIVAEMAKEFGSDQSVIGWQIDNEIYPQGRGCCCDVCISGFQKAMARKYSSIKDLNSAWGNCIFSIEYQSFEQLEAPRSKTWHHPSLTTAWMMFQSEVTAEFVGLQADVIRKYSKAPIGTDMMPFNGMGYELTCRNLDIVQFNHYNEADTLWKTVFWFDHARTIKNRPFWNTETSTCWNGGTSVGEKSYREQGFCRANSWIPIALGGEANLYWLWRSHWSGHEVMHGSVVSSCGRPLHIFDEVREIADGFRRCSGFINGTKPVVSGIAVHFSSLAWWMFMDQPMIAGFDYCGKMLDFHRIISEAGWRPDVVDPEKDLSKYRLVCSPFLPALDESGLRGRLLEWIERGGTWIAWPFTDIRRTDATKFTHAPFGSLEEWTGAYCKYEIPGLPRAFNMKWDDGHSSKGSLWYNAFEPRNADTIAEYTDGPMKGLSAVVRRKCGKGSIVLLGTVPEPDDLLSIFSSHAASAGLRHGHEASANVLAVPREGKEGSGLIAVEIGGAPGSLRIERPMTNLLDGRKLKPGRIKLRPFDVMVLSC